MTGLACKSSGLLRHALVHGGRQPAARQAVRPLGRRLSSAASAGDHVVTSSVPDLELQTGNFTEFLFKDASKWGDQLALTCMSSDQQIKYGSLQDYVGRWGSYLLKQGLRRGAVVAVFSPNTIQYPSLLYGTIRVGRVYMGINPMYTAEEVAHHLTDSGAEMVVTFGPLMPVVKEAMAINKKKLPLLSIGPQTDDSPRVEDILEDQSMGFADPVDVEGTETMSLLYSSGTTGKPKGAEISHNSGIAQLITLAHPTFYAAAVSTPDAQRRYSLMLPLFHISGFMAICAIGLRTGLHLVNNMKFNPETFLKDLIKHKITDLHMVPSVLNFALSRPEFCKANFPDLDNVLVGAAPVPQSAATALKDKFGPDLLIQHAYGMTEVMISHMDPVSSRGSVTVGYTGRLLPNVQAKVLDVSTGLPLPPYEDGEICMRGPTVMKGYLNNEEATKATIDEDGWVHSGDIGHYDKSGNFKVVDRTKDLIKVNALQVSPSEIEDVLLQLPGVTEASVVGVPHPRLGEAPRAYIVADGTKTKEEVAQFLSSKLAKHKQLAGGICFIDQLPKNATGKILRRVLATMAKEET